MSKPASSPKKSKQPARVAEDEVLSALHSLVPERDEGFEGLVAKLMESAIGCKFFVAKSGSQAGRDLSTAGFSGLGVRVECKRYAKERHPSESELLGKLAQSAQSPGLLDCWVLVTTSRLPDQVASALKVECTRRRIDLLLLQEAAEHDTSVGELVVLCATFKSVVIQHFSRYRPDHDLKELVHSLDVVRALFGFEDLSDNLLRQMRGLGFACLSTSAVSWLLDGLRNLPSARSKFSQALIPRSPDACRVRRDSCSEQLSQWLQSGTENAAVLGEEGVGKSWAVADWLAEQDGAKVLPLFVSSQEVVPKDSPDSLLKRVWGKIGGAEYADLFLDRFVRRLLSADESPVRCIIVLDGLNENLDVGWLKLLSDFQAHPQFSKLSVIFTCRRGYWQATDMSLARCKEVLVEEYSDPEYHCALGYRGIEEASVPTGLRAWARKPRWTDLICRLAKESESWEDVTLARLVFEDWKDRYAKKLSLSHQELTPQSFQDFLRGLARDKSGPLSASFSKSALFESVPPYLCQRPRALQELISSGLFEGPESRLRIKDEIVPFALSLALVDELHSLPRKAWEETIERTVDLYGASDLIGDILENSILVAGSEKVEQGELLCAELIKHWVKARNLSDATNRHQRSRAYARLFPESYVRAIDDLWSGELPGNAERCFMECLRLIASQKPKERLMKATFVRWMGLVYPFDRTQQTLQKIGFDQVLPLVSEWFGSDAGPRTLHGFEFTVLSKSEFLKLRLSRLAIRLISEYPRLGAPKAFAVWAITRQAMGDRDEQGLVDWILRFCQLPEMDIPKVVQQLRSSANPLFASASGRLADWSEPYVSRITYLGLGDLAHKAIDPTFRFSKPEVACVLAASSKFDISEWNSSHCTTGADLEWDNLEPSLCRMSQEKLRAVVQTKIRALKEAGSEESFASASLATEFLPLVGAEELESIAISQKRFVENPWKGIWHCELDLFRALAVKSRSGEQWKLFLSRPPHLYGENPEQWIIFHRPTEQATRRIYDLITRETRKHVRCGLLRLLNIHATHCANGLSLKLFRALMLNSDATTRSLTLELAWRGHRADLAADLWSSGWTAQRKDDEGEDFFGSLLVGTVLQPAAPLTQLLQRVTLRALPAILNARPLSGSDTELYLELLSRQFDSVRARALSRRNVKFPAGVLEDNPSIYNGAGYVHAKLESKTYEFGMRGRSWGGKDEGADRAFQNAAERRGWHTPEESKVLAAVIESEAKCGNHWFYRDLDCDALSAAHTHRPNLVTNWLAALDDPASHQALVSAMRPFWESLCIALMNNDYGRALQLYNLLKERQGGVTLARFPTGLTLLEHRLVSHACGGQGSDALELLASDCRSDRDFLNLVAVVMYEERLDMLAELVKKKASQEGSYERATAILLSGMAGLPDQLWLNHFSVEATYWMHDVVERAAEHRARLGYIDHWWRDCLTAKTELQAVCSFRLLLRCADPRVHSFTKQWKRSTASTRDKFICLNLGELRKAAEKRAEKYGKTMFGYNVLMDQVWPWL